MAILAPITPLTSIYIWENMIIKKFYIHYYDSRRVNNPPNYKKTPHILKGDVENLINILSSNNVDDVNLGVEILKKSVKNDYYFYIIEELKKNGWEIKERKRSNYIQNYLMRTWIT